MAAIAAEPDITLAALAARLLAERGVRADTGMLSRFSLVRASASKACCPASRIDGTIARRRARWKHYQGRIDPRRLVFIERPGQRPTCANPWPVSSRRKTRQGTAWSLEDTDLPGSARHDRIDALPSSMVDQRAYFQAYVETVPTSWRFVILALAATKDGRSMRIRAAGAKLPLPPYSLRLNPISRLRWPQDCCSKGRRERSVEATWRQIGSLLHHFAPSECANYFCKRGYASI